MKKTSVNDFKMFVLSNMGNFLVKGSDIANHDNRVSIYYPSWEEYWVLITTEGKGNTEIWPLLPSVYTQEPTIHTPLHILLATI